MQCNTTEDHHYLRANCYLRIQPPPPRSELNCYIRDSHPTTITTFSQAASSHAHVPPRRKQAPHDSPHVGLCHSHPPGELPLAPGPDRGESQGLG